MDSSTSRRSFLKSALTLPLALSAPLGLVHAAETDTPQETGPLPKRPLGRNGPEVTTISLGGMMNAYSPQYLDIAWSMGIRYFDTADCYLKGQSEKIFAQWLAKYPERRKELFLVTKDHPKKPEDLLEMIDKRLEACGTKYIDLFFVHGLSSKGYAEGASWPKSPAFKKVCEALKSSGKVKMVGFSCHAEDLNTSLRSAAEGGFVDAIMTAYTPFFTPGDEFDTALTACHKAGIGLVAMKTMRNAKDVPVRLPEFEKKGLSTHQALLHAVYSDERISAVCSMINNVAEMEVNTGAARTFKAPLNRAEISRLQQVVLSNRRTMCPGCPSCTQMAAKTTLAFQAISRYVSYYEQDGILEARDFYHELPSGAREMADTDLAAIRDGCTFKVDYPDMMKRAQIYFG